jgi:signal transduction histidine kinase/ligand-binding sensor domain-containing protein
MTGLRRQANRLLAVLCISALFLLWVATASAKGPVQRLSQHGHTAWRVQDGLFSSPNGIAQTKDGYLWIGTNAGLARFDGVRFVTWSTLPGLSIAGWSIDALLATSDGSLWIGSNRRVVQLKDGRATQFDVPGRPVRFVEDDTGTVWFAQTRVGDRGGPLCGVANGTLRCYGKPAIPMSNAAALSTRKGGGLWIGNSSALCQWSVGQDADCALQDALKPLANLIGVTSIVTASDATVWVGIAKPGRDLGLGQFADGAWKSFVAPGIDGSSLSVSAMLEDRNGSLWVGTTNRGLYRIHEGQAEHFSAADGLSSDTVVGSGLFEDREGTVWVATSAGLDAFRRLPVSVFSTRQGLPSDGVESVLPARDGRVWIGNLVLSRLLGDKVEDAPLPPVFRDKAVTSMLEDHAGRLWIGLESTLNVFDKGVLRPILGADGRDVGVTQMIVEDADRDVWVATAGQPNRLLRIRDGVIKEQMPAERFGRPSALAPGPSGGIWLGYADGTIAAYRDDALTKFGPDAISSAGIAALLAESNGTVLAATTRGLLVQRGASRRLLNAEGGLPCDALQAIVRDAADAVWMSASCGLIRIDNEAFEQWLANPGAGIRSRLLDATDGVQPGKASFMPRARRGADGRLWFANGAVAQVVDPAALRRNDLPPAVLIEEITADRKGFPPTGAIKLAPQTRDIEIRYTALSFVVPHKVKFQYQLEGRDHGWQDAGTRRQAFYTDLPPGAYRFRVKACNSDGVWNETGASLDFEVPPAFFQTKWFAALCIIFSAATLYGFYIVRMRQVAGRVRDRLAVKHDERERIARDLHDTLLQSTQGLILRFQAASNRIPEGDPTRQVLDKALERADEVLAEGRDRVLDLRVHADALRDLPTSFAATGNELAQGQAATFRTLVEGRPRQLVQRVKQESYSIGREALINAFAHAHAGEIEVQIMYGNDDFRLRVRDDGRGIESGALEAGSRPGHWGLQGMRERALQIGAQLAVWTSPGAGTEIELLIPAAVAYGSQGPRHGWPRRFGRRS